MNPSMERKRTVIEVENYVVKRSLLVVFFKWKCLLEAFFVLDQQITPVPFNLKAIEICTLTRALLVTCNSNFDYLCF